MPTPYRYVDRIRDGYDLLLIDGDNVFDCDLSVLVARHPDPGVDGTLLVERLSRRRPLECDCRFDGDRVLQDVEKEPDDPPDPSYVDVCFQTAMSQLVAACRDVERLSRGKYEMATAIRPAVYDGERIVGVECSGWHVNVSMPGDL